MDSDLASANEFQLALLLADPSVCLRWLVLRHLMKRTDDDCEVVELASQRRADPLVSELINQQDADGSWPANEQLGYGGAVQHTAQALMRLGYLGFGSDLPAVTLAAQFLFSVQDDDGSWPLSLSAEGRKTHSNYDQIPLQTALPLRGLAACGFATDPRSERAYDWLLSVRLDDGAWPTGYSAASYGYVAGYRRLAHSRWGCRSNTTAALMCFASHPERCSSPEAIRGLDLLLGRETNEKKPIGFDIARTLGFEPARGFFTYYGVFDLALVLKLCSRIGASSEDKRVARILSVVSEMRGRYGLWQYVARPSASRWVTYDLLRTLNEMSDNPEWISMEPITPFAPYPSQDKRY
jgi:hypothetical protein